MGEDQAGLRLTSFPFTEIHSASDKLRVKNIRSKPGTLAGDQQV